MTDTYTINRSSNNQIYVTKRSGHAPLHLLAVLAIFATMFVVGNYIISSHDAMGIWEVALVAIMWLSTVFAMFQLAAAMPKNSIISTDALGLACERDQELKKIVRDVIETRDTQPITKSMFTTLLRARQQIRNDKYAAIID